MLDHQSFDFVGQVHEVFRVDGCHGFELFEAIAESELRHRWSWSFRDFLGRTGGEWYGFGSRHRDVVESRKCE